MNLDQAIAILKREVDGPVGVSISTEGGGTWSTFRFAGMENPHKALVCEDIAVALETLLRAVKVGLVPREMKPCAYCGEGHSYNDCPSTPD